MPIPDAFMRGLQLGQQAREQEAQEELRKQQRDLVARQLQTDEDPSVRHFYQVASNPEAKDADISEAYARMPVEKIPQASQYRLGVLQTSQKEKPKRSLMYTQGIAALARGDSVSDEQAKAIQNEGGIDEETARAIGQAQGQLQRTGEAIRSREKIAAGAVAGRRAIAARIADLRQIQLDQEKAYQNALVSARTADDKAAIESRHAAAVRNFASARESLLRQWIAQKTEAQTPADLSDEERQQLETALGPLPKLEAPAEAETVPAKTAAPPPEAVADDEAVIQSALAKLRAKGYEVTPELEARVRKAHAGTK